MWSICVGFARGPPVELISLIPATMALLAISGYIYGADMFVGQMPLYSAAAILLLSSGLLSLRSDEGFMAKVTSNSFGGFIA